MDHQSTIEIKKENGDWKDNFIRFALEEKGWTYASLGEANQLGKSTLRNAIRQPWPKGESIIASALNLSPIDIWPSRYQNKRG